MRRKLEKLQQLLVATKEMELSRFALISAEEKEKSTKIEELRVAKARSKIVVAFGVEVLPIIHLKTIEKWDIWMEIELRNQNSELAILAAKKEEQKKLSKIAMGRMDAFEKLVERNIRRRK